MNQNFKHFKSKLNECLPKVYESKDVDEAKKHILDTIGSSEINPHMKKHMELVVGSLDTLIKVQTYATNSLFRFEGLSVNKYSNNR
jgi:hypothetical protein